MRRNERAALEYKEQIKAEQNIKRVVITSKCNGCMWGTKCGGNVLFCFRMPCVKQGNELCQKDHSKHASVQAVQSLQETDQDTAINI